MTRYKITDAPSKWSLHLAFFDKTDEGNRRPVMFVIRAKDETVLSVHVIINSLAWEDGSGESWNFTGHVNGLFQDETRQFSRGAKVNGYFTTNIRRGWIEISLPNRATK